MAGQRRVDHLRSPESARPPRGPAVRRGLTRTTTSTVAPGAARPARSHGRPHRGRPPPSFARWAGARATLHPAPAASLGASFRPSRPAAVGRWADRRPLAAPRPLRGRPARAEPPSDGPALPRVPGRLALDFAVSGGAPRAGPPRRHGARPVSSRRPRPSARGAVARAGLTPPSQRPARPRAARDRRFTDASAHFAGPAMEFFRTPQSFRRAAPGGAGWSALR